MFPLMTDVLVRLSFRKIYRKVNITSVRVVVLSRTTIRVQHSWAYAGVTTRTELGKYRQHYLHSFFLLVRADF